jgi:hypothetical protein
VFLAHFQDANRSAERASTQSAPLDGLLVSAGVRFKKDRQKDRQHVQLQNAKAVRLPTSSLDHSMNYQNTEVELTMLLRSSLVPIKQLNSKEKFSNATSPHSHSIILTYANILIQQDKFFRTR